MSLYQIAFTSFANDDESNPYVNTFYYDVDDVLPSSEVALGLADAFYTEIVNAAAGWKAIVQVGMDSDTIVVTTPFNPTVLGIKNTAVVGLRSGGQMPRFVSWGFKSERKRADIRAGFKRIGLISETDTSGSVPAVGMLTALNDFAGLMSSSLPIDVLSGSFNAVPVIVKRIAYTTPSGKPAYRLPDSPTEYQFATADNWVFQSITTQNSRKT